MKIPLTQGKNALIDPEDFKKVKPYKWYALFNRRMWYAKATAKNPKGKKSAVAMHRLVMGLDFGDPAQVDHRNGDGLDNRKANLRLAMQGQNIKNQKKRSGTTSSKFKGVYKRDHFWKAQISVNGEKLYLGRFDSEEDAARAYNVAAVKHHGDFACLNPL